MGLLGVGRGGRFGQALLPSIHYIQHRLYKCGTFFYKLEQQWNYFESKLCKYFNLPFGIFTGLRLKNEYTTDGVHLNKTGYGVMSKMVRNLLKKEGLTI